MLSQFEDKVPVSAAATGALIGSFFPGIGTVLGAGIGAAIDAYRMGEGAKKKLKRLKRNLMNQLIARYQTTVFATAVERLGPAMIHLVELGLKPGTPEFDNLLVRKLAPDVGYKGSCHMELRGPAPLGQPRPLIAKIDRKGAVTGNAPQFNMDHGPQWAKICDELYSVALKAWAEDQKEVILTEREMEAEKEEKIKSWTTQILVNGAILVLLAGVIRRKKRVSA